MNDLSFVVADEAVGSCHRFWSVANWNKPFRLLDPAYMQRLAGYAPFVDELNLVYILGGRQPGRNNWFKGVGPDGKIDADFTGLIKQLRACVDMRYTPWIVLDNVPYEMSDPPTENVYGNTAPAADVKVWGAYVKAAIEAMVEAFGAETVSGWWFRVGTEPDYSPGHWSGTQQEFFDHYDYTIEAVTSVLPDVRIGPGNILNPVEGEYGVVHADPWGLDLIDHCGAGRNAVTGQVGTRMDWFSCSWYGRVGWPLKMFDQAIDMMRERMGEYPQFADTPLCIGEFTVLHDANGVRLFSGETTEWSASFYAGIADRVYRHGVRKVYEWHHATDGVMHPKGHVVWMLERMAGGDRLAVSAGADGDEDCGVIATRGKGEVYLLIYHHDTERVGGPARRFNVTIDGLADAKLAGEWTVDADHASWARVFEADCKAEGIEPREGSGQYEGGVEFAYGHKGWGLWRQNRAKYLELARLPETADATIDRAGGRLAISVEMPSHCVRLVRLETTR